jgi:hypothetical protein
MNILSLVRGSMTNYNGFSIGFIDAAITITLNSNHFLQLTIADCLMLVPFPPGLRASSLP